MVIHICRIMRQLNDAHDGAQVASCVPEQAMRTAYNPFMIELESGSSVHDGAKIRLGAGESGYMLCCWGVSIKHIYPVLYMLPADVKKTFSDSQKALDKLHSYCLGINMTRINCCENLLMTLCPDVPVDLGPVPRDRYPLVLLLVSDFLATSSSDDVEHIVFHGLVIHLKDSICIADSNVISHLVRTVNEKPVDLKHLYTSETPENSSSFQLSDVQLDSTQNSQTMDQGLDPSTESQTCNSTAVCIVCLVNPVNKVILPCRHACVCDRCFDKVVQCPMCRGVIQSCFSLADRQGDNEEQEEEDEEQHSKYWFERLNDWLNKKLGFT